MATHSSVLAWRIPGTGSLVGCHLWGHTEPDTTEVTNTTHSLLIVKLSMFFLIPDSELEAPWSFVEVSSQGKKHSFLACCPLLFLSLTLVPFEFP